MNEKIINVVDTDNEKHKFHQNKTPFFDKQCRY